MPDSVLADIFAMEVPRLCENTLIPNPSGSRLTVPIPHSSAVLLLGASHLSLCPHVNAAATPARHSPVFCCTKSCYKVITCLLYTFVVLCLKG